MDTFDDDFEIVDSDNSLYDMDEQAIVDINIEDTKDFSMVSSSYSTKKIKTKEADAETVTVTEIGVVEAEIEVEIEVEIEAEVDNDGDSNEEEEEEEEEKDIIVEYVQTKRRRSQKKTSRNKATNTKKNDAKSKRKLSKKKSHNSNSINKTKNNSNSNNSSNAKEYQLLLKDTTQTNMHLKQKLLEFESELLLVKKMKNKMQKQCMKYENLVSDNSALNMKMNRELKTVSENASQLKQERKEVECLRQQLSNDRQSLSDVLSCMKLNVAGTDNKDNNNSNNNSNNANNDVLILNENRDLLCKLRKYFDECSNMKSESEEIQAMCAQQRQFMNDCKNQLQNMRNSNSCQSENCLISLDKSKSFACKECGIDVALDEEIQSKCYQVGQGSFTEQKRGYLFKTAVNLVCGPEKTENFTTGAYQISWVSCMKCQSKIGWKYISADNNTNNSKVGKYCLARYSLTSPEERIEAQK
jgi:hypothetical protein